jgi:transposase
MYHSISRDVKIAAIKLYERSLLDLDDILDCCGFSRSTWFRILKLWNTTGDVISYNKSLPGQLRLLNYNDIQYLTELINQNPDYFLDELLHLLQTNRFISVHYPTIHKQLSRTGVSRKRLQRIALERNEECRALFVECMAQYEPEELGFINEVSKDERTIGRRFGRSKRGRRACKKQVFVRGRHTSTVGCFTLDGFVSGTLVEGSLTKIAFLEWMEFSVVSFTLSFYHLPILIVLASKL